MSNNCYGCKFLYSNGTGYSDYTWMETYIVCALGINTALNDEELEEPSDYEDKTKSLRTLALLAFTCDKYGAGEHITVSPDGNVSREPSDDHDIEQMKAILDYDYEAWLKGERHDY